MRRMLGSLLSLLMLVATAQAGDCGHSQTTCCPAPCQPYSAPCAPQYVERTVMVPQYVTEVRKVACTEYRTECRPQTVTSYQRVPVVTPKTCEYTVIDRQTVTREVPCTVYVPVVREVEKTYCVQVPYCETRQATRTVCRPVWREVQQTYTVQVPVCETRQGVKKVWQCVPSVALRTICEDQGHWEVRSCPQPCGHTACCAPVCHATYKVWVPNIVHKQIEVPVHQYQCVEQPFEYTVTVCRPEQRTCVKKVCEYVHEQVPYEYQVTLCRPEYRTCKVKVCEMVPQQQTRTVCHTVCVPRKVAKTINVTHFECVPVQKTVNVNVCVPVTVEKEIPVQVCKWIPQTVQCQVAPGYGHHCCY